MKTFAICLNEYLDHCLSCDQSETTIVNKKSRLMAFVGWCLANGITGPVVMLPEHLEGYRKHLYKEYRTRSGKPLDIATRRHHLTNVICFTRWLKRMRVIPIDPGEDFDLPRVPRRLTQVWLTADEARQVARRAELYGLRGIRDRAVLEALFATGIRRKEVIGLDLGDVDFKAETVKVRKGKGGHERYVPIAERACRAILDYLKYVRPKLATLKSGNALFLDNRGHRFKPQAMSRLIKQYVARAGVNKQGACNLYRHSTATLMLEGGADIRHVQEMLGHADISTTQVYTHVAIESLKKVYKRTHPANRP